LFQGKKAAGWPVICPVIGDVERPRVAKLKSVVSMAASLPTTIITSNEAIGMSVRCVMPGRWPTRWKTPFACAARNAENRELTRRESLSMSIKSDRWIRRMATEHAMIEPFEPGQVRVSDGRRVVSWGTSSYGYDIRCADEFKIFTNINSTIVDPKNFDEKSFVDFKGDVCIIPPNSFALARTVEYFRIPRSVLTICLGKSTYARCGIIVNVTPFEPEWEGYVTLEFSNTTPLPAKIYAGEGCAQVLFFESDEVCETSYKDRGGKYQGQIGVTLPKT
jgi:dCTP deaminase